MPFITVKTNKKVEHENEIKIKTYLGKAISLIPGKSENWLMIELEDDKKMYFKGSNEDLAMIEVKVYGKPLSSDSLNTFTKEVTDQISSILNIPTSRIYISYFFTEAWGFDGENF